MNDKIIIWRCNSCGKINYSNPFRHHYMDCCECDQSGMDLETYGCRIMGDTTNLMEIDPFFNEITVCLIEQGYSNYFITLEDKIQITWEGVELIRDIEDNIIEDYIMEVIK